MERGVSSEVAWHSPNIRLFQRLRPLSIARERGQGVRLSRQRGERISPGLKVGTRCIPRRNVRWYENVKGASQMGKKDKGGKETRKPKKPKA